MGGIMGRERTAVVVDEQPPWLEAMIQLLAKADYACNRNGGLAASGRAGR
jgi:hypothetical protein